MATAGKIDFEKCAQDLGVTLPDQAGMTNAIYKAAVKKKVYAAMVAAYDGDASLRFFQTMEPATFGKEVEEVVKAKKAANAGQGQGGGNNTFVPAMLAIAVILLAIIAGIALGFVLLSTTWPVLATAVAPQPVQPVVVATPIAQPTIATVPIPTPVPAAAPVEAGQDSCDRWSTGHVAPSGLVCVIAVGDMATTGSDVFTSGDGVTWKEVAGFGGPHNPVTILGPVSVYCPYGCSFEPKEAPPPPTATASSTTDGYPKCSQYQSGEIAPNGTICHVDGEMRTGSDVRISTNGGANWVEIPNFGIANHPPEPVPWGALIECPYGCSFNAQ